MATTMDRIRVISVVAGSLACVLAGQRSAHATLDPDQAVAALASVVQTRAKVVAAQTIADELSGSLCSSKLPVDPNGSGLKYLCFGGDLKKCGKSAPDADDVFVNSCHLIKDVSLDLVDPHLLSAISRDAVGLMLRLSAYKLDAQAYKKARLTAFEQYLATSMTLLSRKGADLFVLADPTQDFAGQLQDGLPDDIFSKLAAAPEVAALTAKLVAILNASCAPPNAGTGACKQLAATPLRWFPAAGAAQTFLDDHDARLKFFYSQFDPGTPYANARNLPCDLANVGAAADIGCRQAQLLVNLNDILQKIPATAQKIPGTARPLYPASMSDVRELTYILLEESRHAKSLQVLNGGQAVPEFAAFVAAIRKVLPPSVIARAELASGVDLIGSVLAAGKADKDGLTSWLKLLGDDVVTIAKTTPLPAGAFAYLDAPAFRAPHLTASVARVRDDLKSMSVLPWLGIEGRGDAGAVLSVVRELADVQTSPEAGLRQLASYVRVLADAITAINHGVVAPSDQALIDAALSLADALDLAAAKDWVGVAIKLTDDLAHIGALKNPPIKRSIGFVRILLSSYEANSIDDAKAIFSAGLETVSSRRERFIDGTVDVGALFAARGGYDSTFAQSGVTTSSALYGLYGPVGVQFAYKHVGLLAYPVDVGSYLTVTNSQSGPVKWQDSLRFGGALYLRPSAEIPIVLGGAGDVRPTIGDLRGSWRVFGFLALELPLYLIY